MGSLREETDGWVDGGGGIVARLDWAWVDWGSARLGLGSIGARLDWGSARLGLGPIRAQVD